MGYKPVMTDSSQRTKVSTRSSSTSADDGASADADDGRLGLRQTIVLFVPVLMMSAFGAYVGFTAPPDDRAIFIERVVGAAWFIAAPIVVAAVLVVLVQLARRQFRA